MKQQKRTPSTLLKANEIYNIKLLKLHGSLNWLVCPKCGRFFVEYDKNIAINTLGSVKHEEECCRFCKDTVGEKMGEPLLESLIITPTYMKELNNLHIQNIWHNAYIELTEADEVVFIGYSFPEADFEMRYLLKRAIGNDTSIKVILHETDNPAYYRKKIEKSLIEPDMIDHLVEKINLPEKRYNSFFGKSVVEYNYNGIENYFGR